MDALGMTAPVESVMVPKILPSVDCARTGKLSKSRAQASHVARENNIRGTEAQFISTLLAMCSGKSVTVWK
jgi:hypothetical protein